MPNREMAPRPFPIRMDASAAPELFRRLFQLGWFNSPQRRLVYAACASLAALESGMITCFIRYEIDPFKVSAFEEYARNWGQAIPRCGADLVGYFAPHEGSSTTAYGVYNIENLAAYEQYRARLSADPAGRANYEFAKKEQFIRREDRIFLRLASAPHTKLVKP